MAMQKPIMIAADLGYEMLKAYNGKDIQTLKHTVMRSNESTWQATCETQPGSLDMLKIDGVPYAFGDLAIRRGFIKEKRAERYKQGYYDIQYLRMLVPYLANTAATQRVWASISYPPADHDAAKGLRQLARGEHIIERPNGKRYLVDTEHVATFPELSGSCSNFKTVDLGNDTRRRKLMDGRTFVGDIGGGTTDVAVSELNLVPDLATADSFDTGVSSIKESIGREVRSRYFEQFRSGISDAQVSDIIQSKQVRTGPGIYDSVANIVEENINIFLSQLDAMASRNGGWFSFKYVAFTGGGADAFAKELRQRYGGDHEVVFLGKSGTLQFSNVHGGFRLLQVAAREMGWR